LSKTLCTTHLSVLTIHEDESHLLTFESLSRNSYYEVEKFL